MTRTLVVIMLVFLPLQPALDDQCQDYTYAKLHPTICPNAGGNGFGIGGSVGGGGGGSFLGGLLHTLTGGLL